MLAGVPLTSLGVTLSQLQLSTIVESAAAIVTAVAGAIAASLQWRVAALPGTPRFARGLLCAASVALAAGLFVTSAYRLRGQFQTSWHGEPSISLFHGVVGVIGFAVPAAWAWRRLE